MNIAEGQRLKDRVTALERQVALLLSERNPQSEEVSAGGNRLIPTSELLVPKRGPGRPRKEPEAA